MKKHLKAIVLMIFILACVLVCTSCTNMNLGAFMPHTHADANKDTKCDICGTYVAPQVCTVHNDVNNDGICDNVGCGAPVLQNMTEVVFESKKVSYNGKPQKIEAVGAPEGATVVYDVANEYTDVGVYDVTVTVTMQGYNDYTATATLEIVAKSIKIVWNKANLGIFPANGEEPTFEYTLSGVAEGDEVEVEFAYNKNCDFTVPGKFTATATSKNPNYKIKTTDGSDKSANKASFTIDANVYINFETGIDGETLEEETVEIGSAIDEPKTLRRDGYTFLGWYNGEELWDFDAPATTSMTLTAKWQAVEYTITYYLDGGVNASGNPATFTVESLEYLEAPTKENAVFLGWYLDKDFTGAASTIGARASNLSVYARWADVEYTEIVKGQSVNSENSAITLSTSAANGSFVYTFTANVTSFADDGVIYIGRGFETLDGSYVKITKDKVYVYTNGETLSEQEYTHTREMLNYIVVNITVGNSSTRVEFITANGTSSFGNVAWSGRNGEIFFKAENAEFDNATFGWYAESFKQNVWIIGDETIGTADDTVYTHQLTAYGYGNYLAISAKGLDSEAALECFKEAVAIRKPIYAIWSFRTDSSEDYDENTVAFVAYCKDNGIIPVLTTQASTADFDNTERNAAVKASGERYIDFDAMTNYDDVLSNYNYTVQGAKMLFARFMADFPEIICAESAAKNVTADTITGEETVIFPENYDPANDVAYYPDGSLKSQYGELLETRMDTRDEVMASAIKMTGVAIKDGRYLIFNAKIDGVLGEDQTILIGHGYMESTGQWLEINGKYAWGASYFSYGKPQINPTARKEAHNLTIKNFITVIFACDEENSNVGATIITDGGYATVLRGEKITGFVGDFFASAANVNLTDCTLSWTCSSYDKDIWIVGDSYMTVGDSGRWPTHVIRAGYRTSLMIARPGMTSEEGLADLKYCLEHDTPKYIVWCHGMNNPDSSGVVNSGYKSCLLEVIEICKKKGIELAVATIPNCPNIDNSPKNNFIWENQEEYGYRVVDFARAVNGYELNSPWYEGMLYTDNIHPDVLGAKALYMQILLDFPEIMGGSQATIYSEKADTLNSGSSVTIEAPDKIEKNKAFIFTADFNDAFTGTILIGNGKGVEGGTWIEIDSTFVTVYKTVDGEATVVTQVNNMAVLKDLVYVRIHVKGDTAYIDVVSTAESNDYNNINHVFSFNVEWSFAGDVFASVSNASLNNVSLKWFTAS